MRIRAAHTLLTALYLALACGGALAFRGFERERSREAAAYRSQIEATSQLARFLAGSRQLTASVQGFAATGDPRYAEAYWREVDVTRSRDRAAGALDGMDLTEEERALIARARASSDALISVETRVIEAVEAGERERAIQLVFGPAYQRALREIHGPGLQLQRLLERRLNEAISEQRRRAAAWWDLSRLLVLLDLLLVVGVLLLLHPRVVGEPLRRLNQQVRALLAGEAPPPLDLGPAVTEIRELAASMEAYQQKAAQLVRDQWAKAQQVRITAALQRLHEPQALADCFLRELAPLIGVASATFYLRESGRERLRRVGAYALVDPADAPTTVAFGDGLVGECARQGRPLELEAPPPDALVIASGTGRAPAGALLVVPVRSGEEVLAVIELASFHPPEPHQRSLLNDLLPLLALALEALPVAAPLP
ncbi:GAF domain-containing protein [Cyanobium sp. FGCU-52]|nr:GAF domain-containing protein [Cyanobium sp. FGCU52]